jgi:hypothetical protein
MQYRARFQHQPGVVHDIFDGSYYHSLRGHRVKLDGRIFTIQETHQDCLGIHPV